MEKKALIAIAFIIIVALLMNNAPQQTTQQKKLRAQTTATVDFSDTDTIHDPAGYDDSFNRPNITSNATPQEFIQKLKRALVNLPVPRFIGPSIPKETPLDPCAINKKSPIKYIQPRLPFLPSVENR